MIPMLDPKPPSVFVTDTTSGFRAAICQRFHEAGARIIATSRRKERLDMLKRQLGERCYVFNLNVTDRDAVFSAIDALPPDFREPNVCVANAGLALGLEQAHNREGRHGLSAGLSR